VADGISGPAIALMAFQAPVAGTAPVSLCVGVAPLQQGAVRGQASQWEVGAWTVGGNLPDAEIQLQSTAGASVPVFTFGCGNGDGTSACDLGAVDATSAQRLFQAEVTVPLAATTLTTVGLTVTGSAAGLASDPAAAASVVVQASATPQASAATPPAANVASLSAMPLTGSASPTPTLSPGGSAAGLFPTVAPGSPLAEGASPAADVSTLAGSDTAVGSQTGGNSADSEIAEGAGLAALAMAMILAVARVSFRVPAPRPTASATAAAAPPPEGPAERPE
jgi:hypothetical protein